MKRNLFESAIVWVVILIAMLVVAAALSCQTVKDPPPLSCIDFLKGRMQELALHDYQILEDHTMITINGAVSEAIFVNPRGQQNAECLVDTESLVKEALTMGYQQTGECQLGGKVWYSLQK